MQVKITVEIDGRQSGIVEHEVSGSAAEIEEQTRSLTQRCGRIVLETGFLQISAASPRPCCCQVPMESRGKRCLTLETTFGPVVVSRTRYRCRSCGAEVYPADEAWRCGRHRMTYPLARRICQLATVEHFQRLESLLADQHGVAVGHEAILELVHDVGGVLEQARLAATVPVLRRAPDAAREIQPQIRPKRICVSCDGIMYCTNQTEPVPEAPGQHRLVWQQMKVGCVSWQDDDDHWHKQILWGRESPEEFGASLFELACRCGYQQATEKLFSADGGAWCWDIHSRYFNAAQGILDWYHASEHVWGTARTLGTDETTTQEWAETALNQLWTTGGNGIVAWLEEQLRPRRGRSRTAIEALLSYFHPRTPFTDYPVYRARGWPIGTGMMESTCKQLVGLRLKGPGMHWTETGALAVTALRATDLNGKWDAFWNQLVLTV